MMTQSVLNNQSQTPASDEVEKKAALYLRVSTTEQATEGYSIQAQEQNGREQAFRLRHEVVEVYSDEGESGKSTKNRLAYQQLMADARQKKFDVVIIWKLTRLGRNMLDVLQTVEELLSLGIGLYSISEQFDITTSSGKLMLQLLGSFGEFERNQISENVSMTMQSLVRDHKRYAGGRRLGYVSGVDENGQKQLVIEPEEAKIVQVIYAKYLGGDGYKAIANYLNRQGYQTLKGNAFSITAIKNILHNKIYGGYIEYARYLNWDTKRRRGKNPSPILVKGIHEPIISEAIYLAVQERLKVESKQPSWTQSGENVLTGLLRCPECGAPMAASNVTNTLKGGIKKRIRYYSCSTFRNKGASVCHANSIRADNAETFVAERLKEIVRVPQILESLVQQLNEERLKQIQPLEQELAVIAIEQEELLAKIAKWEVVLEENPELVETLIERLKELRTRKSNNQRRENEILHFLKHKDQLIELKDVQTILHGIDAMLAGQEKKTIKELYRFFIKKITFDKETKDNIQMTMAFDEKIIAQLNQFYQETLSKSDRVLFVLQTAFELVV
ncbi:site-specific DNA recombinase [Enterococcus rivorum]|nr:recombinase family protein [Enterococcus rivorum]MBP2098921.1 site-specific DNA recombinase [Enterococcus rivorum]